MMGCATVVAGTDHTDFDDLQRDIVRRCVQKGPTRVHLMWRPFLGQVWAILEGEWLPASELGQCPPHFASIDHLMRWPELPMQMVQP